MGITPVDQLDIPSVDPATFEMSHDEALASMTQLADDTWIAKSLFGYSILTYSDVTAILRDKRWHNAASKIPEMRGITDPELIGNPDKPSILAAEGDVHTRLRRLVAKAFSPRSADRLRPFMREVMNGLIDPVAPTGSADIVADITEPYPIPIICELLGAPKQDWQLFSRWAEDVLRIFNGTVLDELDIIKKARTELTEYTIQMIAERRNDPREDLLTDLIAAEEDGDTLDTEELVMMVNAVIIGGTDTTRNQLGCSVALFAEHPDQWKLLADDPELAPRAIEESMRHFGAIRGTGRFASEDIVYRDILFPAGTFVFPSTATGNRDESVFPDASTFDIRKEPAGSPHLTLGSGIHYCLGAWLARAELQEALPILARRMPDLALADGVKWKPPGTAIFGPDSLPVTFTPTA
ncbi:MAG: cytochrome P450 [Ilumatobacter sp.]|jgi:cytochrome P450|uniref:cytochrome P450 n=1 Tax=Ilumatobacter sp. TaxID=1967498 RepID=UPI001DE7C352|nr:cytochrome P450 [Ilumatobacter sp.]MBT5554337.1 cytochrome P450 [Ilumatobacter sp.]MBT5866452.1 cytochrome P450 [Ilumatobacter sp.]MDG0975032.1 cytochrome P450 [Ilumatobacter sp.]MDG1392749.1 cytochrome P450 [Ilumatobacter sp.]